MTCGSEAVGIDEPADLRIVITTLQVIESRLAVIVVATVANGVDRRQRARSENDLSPGVVAVLGLARSAGVDDLNHIALQVCDIVIDRAVAAERVRHTTLVVEEFKGVRPVVFRDQLSTLPGVLVFNGAAPGSNRLGQAQAVHVVGEGQCGMAARCADAGKTLAVHPGHRRPVVPGRRVADRVIGDGVPVIRRQQVTPLGIAIGKGIGSAAAGLCLAQHIAGGIVGVGIGRSTANFCQQLVLAVVGVGCGCAAGDRRDVPDTVVAVIAAE